MTSGQTVFGFSFATRLLARDLALFHLAMNSKLRACDSVKLRVLDVAHDDRVA
jgi:hypothetical protein